MTQKIKNIRRVRKKQPLKSKFNPRPYSEKVLANYFLKYDKYKRFWIYDKNAKIWKNEAQVRLNSILRKEILGSEDYKRYCVGEVIDDLKGLTFVDEQIEEPGAHLIPFENKIYDLESGKFLDYDPNYFFINKVRVKINQKNRKCPTIDRIFKDLVSKKDLVTLYEIAAYTLYRGYPYPKLFVLYGSGGNGKTTYAKILTKLLGKENISLVSITDLQFDKFRPSQLNGKLLNVSGEMDYRILKNTSKLKQCCGEDLIYCERKFREPFPFCNYAKMIFLTNQVPLTRDRSVAFYRRIFFLEFPNTFIVGKGADPTIVQKIPEEEFEGLAWKCLRKLKRLHGRKFVFKNHPKIEAVTKQYEKLSNPLDTFLAENTKIDINAHIPGTEFAKRYCAYLTKGGLRVWTPKEIGGTMKEKGFEQRTFSTVGKGGNRTTYRGWCGLRWK